MVKKYLMTLVWRISQTGPILSLFFWSTALAGIFWPILGKAGVNDPPGPLYAWLIDLGVPADRATLVGLALLFLVFAALILVIGLLYDRFLELWREQMDILVERNPYVDTLLVPKEQLQWDQFYLPLARALYKLNPDPGLKDAIERGEEWVKTGKIRPR